jgi:hypothetical protein
LRIGRLNDIEFNTKRFEKILRCFDEKDVEGLKSLLTPASRSSLLVDNQINEAFKAFEGKSVSSGKVPNGGRDVLG